MSFKSHNYIIKTQLQRRSAKRSRQHNSLQQAPGSHVIEHEIMAPVFVPIQRGYEPYLRCLKCRRLIRRSLVTDHLLRCQPEGATCGKCGQIIPPKEFLVHWEKCEGKMI